MSANEEYIAFMLLAGFITSFLCKNMIVVLFFAICIPNILRFVMEWKQLQEGLASIEENKDEKDENDENDEKDEKDEKKSNETRISDLIDKMKNHPDTVSTKPDLKIPQDKLSDLQKRIADARKQISNIPDEDISKEMTELLESQDKIITKLQTIGDKLT
jgi:Sec-independent protein translocase protein TatA